MKIRSKTSKPRTSGHQAGRYLVAWLVGVIVATGVIGTGLYMGLQFLSARNDAMTANAGGNGNAPVHQGAESNVVMPREANKSLTGIAPDQTTHAGVVVDETVQMTTLPAAVDNSRVDETDGGLVNAATRDSAHPGQPDNEDEQIERLAPRAATTGGVAAARLPSGEEVLIPAGERVDDYLRRTAEERGIQLPEELVGEENPSDIITEASLAEELTDEELRDLDLLEQELFDELNELNDANLLDPDAGDGTIRAPE